MKILLVHPPIVKTDDLELLNKCDDGDNSQVPIGLYNLATILIESGYDVTLENFALTPYSKAINKIVEISPDLLGISCNTMNRHIALTICKDVKEKLPSVKTILGGPHPTPLYEQILHFYPQVDFIAVGESEISFPEFIKRLNNSSSYDDIMGIAFRENGKVVFNGIAELVQNLDEIPIPAKYFRYDVISTSRGCPGSCTFCSTPSIWGKKIRFRSKENILEELDILRNKYDLRKVHFKDDTFTANKKRVIEVCKEMIERGYDFWWTCDTRVDFIDEERLYWMKKAGCYYISYGVESGSETILRNINKHTSINQIKKTAESTRKYCILMRFYLMAGNKGETNKTLLDTINLIDETKPNFCFVSKLGVLPGTAVFDDCLKSGLLREDVWMQDKNSIVYVNWGKPVEQLSNHKKLMTKYHNIGLFSKDKSPHFEFTVDELKSVVDLIPDSYITHYDLALKLKNNGNHQEAIECYKKVIELREDFGKAYLDLAECYEGLNDGKNAEDYLLKFLSLRNQIKSNIVFALLKLGKLYSRKNNFESAILTLSKAIEIEPNVAEPYFYLGDVYFRINNIDNALKMLTIAMKLDPKFPDTYNTLGKCFFVKNVLDQALKAFHRAMELGFKNLSELYNNIGVVYFALNDFMQAKKYLEMALKENPKNADAIENLKMIEGKSL